jgi:hypothetical protein
MGIDEFEEAAKKGNAIASKGDGLLRGSEEGSNSPDMEETLLGAHSSSQDGESRPTIPPRVGMSEVEQIKAIEIMNTNFVFLFGGPQRGKTVVTASVVSFMHDVVLANGKAEPHNRKRNDKLSSRSAKDEAGDVLLQKILTFRAKRLFPERTLLVGETDPIYVNVRFTPKDSRDHPALNFTFLEMPGDSLQKILTPEGGRGDLPSSIDVFFRAHDAKAKLSFVLVTDHESAPDDDQLIASFIDYVMSECDGFDAARFLLLVSKWDDYDGGLSLTEFVRTAMPLTFGKLYDPKHSMSAFSIGKVTVADEKPMLKEYNSDYPKKVLGWLYRNITGKSPYDPGFMKALFSKFIKYS